MKILKKTVLFLTVLTVIFSEFSGLSFLYQHGVGSPSLTGLRANAAANTAATDVIPSGKVTTYTMKDVTFRYKVDEIYVNGKNLNALQGCDATDKYMYTVRENNSDETLQSGATAALIRTDLDTGDQIVMNYYASISAAAPSVCNTMGHGNGITISEAEDGTQYLYATTGQKSPGVAKYIISGTNYYFCGYFTLSDVGSGMTYAPVGIRAVKSENGYTYLLSQYGVAQLYYCRIAYGDNGGATASSPKTVNVAKVCWWTLENALFADDSGSAYTQSHFFQWVYQDFYYSREDDAIYLPGYNGKSADYDPDGQGQKSEIVIVPGVNKYIDAINFDSLKNGSNPRLFPSDLSFYFEDSNSDYYEIEALTFRKGKNRTDRRMYFTAQSHNNHKNGIYSVSYEEGSIKSNSIVGGNSIVYNVQYDANGGKLPAGAAYRQQMTSSVLIKGITTKLKKNTFVKDGCVFAGWHLSKSDGTSLYKYANGKTYWKIPGEEEAGASLALYADEQKVSQLCFVNGQTVTLSAQWKTNTSSPSSSKVFYVDFNNGGGSGSMTRQTVTYGQGVPLTKCSFTKTGYKFVGWHLKRASDSKSAFINRYTGGVSWYLAGNVSDGMTLAVYKDQQTVGKLSETDKDVVTLTALWVPVAETTQYFYVNYDGNGATGGSMSQQRITYGGTNNLTANSFVKTGWMFGGWTCCRLSDGYWLFNKPGGGQAWTTYNDGYTKGYSLCIYTNKSSISKTTGVNCDMVFMYAYWIPTADSFSVKTRYTVNITVGNGGSALLYANGKDAFSGKNGSPLASTDAIEIPEGGDFYLGISPGKGMKISGVSYRGTPQFVEKNGKASLYHFTVADENPSLDIAFIAEENIKRIKNNIALVRSGITASDIKEEMKSLLQVSGVTLYNSDGETKVQDTEILCTGMIAKTGSISVLISVAGDTDGDGAVTVLDAENVYLAIQGKNTITGAYADAATGLSENDGNINIIDVLYILNGI